MADLHYRWEWEFKSPAEKIWPYVADTNRFNADAGIPTVKPVPGAQKGGNTRRLEAKLGGMRMEWDEAPFEWEAPRRFGVVRRYHSGPMKTIRVEADLSPREGGGSRLVYQVWIEPRNLISSWALGFTMRWKTAKAFDAVFRRYDEAASRGKTARLKLTDVKFSPGGRERLGSLRRQLLDLGRDADLVERLTDLVGTADELTLMKLRPFELAEEWGVPRRRVLETCLHAVRAGMLDFRWDMLCPLCRGAKETSPSLGGIKSKVHCDSCQIDFDVNFERSVELTFKPNASVRPIEVAEFCVGGPGVTPHIVAQQYVPASATRPLTISLVPGSYRIRAHHLPGARLVRVATEGVPAAEVAVSDDAWPADELVLSPRPTITFRNNSIRELALILERTAWTDSAVTAAEVITLQTFRDLFAREALRPGEQLSVGTVTVLFTDLLESTRLYREVGDAKAFGLVMNHFDVLRRHVADYDGALVKTIGDAVLAVFRRPASAVRAILDAQAEFSKPPPGQKPLFLKAGIHVGPAIAVTLNDRLDYFGSTVNIAARLVGLSSGGDIVISDDVRRDPEVSQVLSEAGHRLEELRAALKGFDQIRFELARVVPPWAAPQKIDVGPKTMKF
jgi:class 3 adenylate cyclase